MSDFIGYLPAVVVVIIAAVILIRGSIRFVKTKGQSACDSCPYSNSCSSKGNCKKR